MSFTSTVNNSQEIRVAHALAAVTGVAKTPVGLTTHDKQSTGQVRLELHSRWAKLEDEHLALELEIDGTEIACRAQFPTQGKPPSAPRDIDFVKRIRDLPVDDGNAIRRLADAIPAPAVADRSVNRGEREAAIEAECAKLGIDRLRDRLDEVERLRQDVIAQISSLPVECDRDIAILLDLAMEYELDPPHPVNGGEAEWIYFREVLRAVRQRVPEVEFTSLRRALSKGDRDALLAGTA